MPDRENLIYSKPRMTSIGVLALLGSGCKHANFGVGLLSYMMKHTPGKYICIYPLCFLLEHKANEHSYTFQYLSHRQCFENVAYTSNKSVLLQATCVFCLTLLWLDLGEFEREQHEPSLSDFCIPFLLAILPLHQYANEIIILKK